MVVLFHSVLGLRPGVLQGAERLRAAGHEVHTPDRYQGQAPFDSYEDAVAFERAIGLPELIARSERSVSDLPERAVYGGWSAGGALAEHFALTRSGAAGLVLIAAAARLSWFNAAAWPAAVPVQVHYATEDPFREEEELRGFLGSVREANARLDFREYALSGHLFDDPSLPAEYSAPAAELMWRRILEFLQGLEP